MRGLLQAANNTFFLYYLFSNLSYLVLLIVALLSSREHHQHLASLRLERIKASPLTPPITLIAPAHNEEGSIVPAVQSLLRVDYPELEVVVVNDGSEDGTLARLREEFGMEPARLLYISELVTAPVRGLYRSAVDPRLIVVDKEAGGSKADAGERGIECGIEPIHLRGGRGFVARIGCATANHGEDFGRPKTRDRGRRNCPRVEWMRAGERANTRGPVATKSHRDFSSDRIFACVPDRARRVGARKHADDNFRGVRSVPSGRGDETRVDIGRRRSARISIWSREFTAECSTRRGNIASCSCRIRFAGRRCHRRRSRLDGSARDGKKG